MKRKGQGGGKGYGREKEDWELLLLWEKDLVTYVLQLPEGPMG